MSCKVSQDTGVWSRARDIANTGEEKEIIRYVNTRLEEKGYDPVRQLAGYLQTGDPTYITNHDGARARIGRVDYQDLLEHIIARYLELEIEEE